MLNKAANLFWSGVTLFIALFVLDAFAGTSTATSLWNACWNAVTTAWNDPTNVTALVTAGAVLAIVAGYDQIREYARKALSGLVRSVLATLSSLADSVKPKANA